MALSGSQDLADNSVVSSKVADGAVATADLASGAVSSDKIEGGAIDAGKLAAGAVGVSSISSALPSVSATHTAAQTMPGLNGAGGGGALIAFDSEAGLWDSQNMHSLSVDNSRLVASVAGVYTITGQVEWEADGVGLRSLAITRNGAVIAQSVIAPFKDADGGTKNTPQSVTKEIKLAAGDYVEMRAFQMSASCGTSACLTKTLKIQPGPSLAMSWLLPG